MPRQEFDLVVAANRLPAACVLEAGGRQCWRRSPGGLVAAMEAVMRARDAAWVGWAGEVGEPPGPCRQDRLLLHPLGLSGPELVKYYDGFSNTTVWPLFHDLVTPAVFHREWWEAYREVNARFARAVADLAAPGATVWVHDYHLQLVPEMVRTLRTDLRIGWFDHIPFPPVEIFARVPWRRALLHGLLGADFLGFQTSTDAENFLRACSRLLGLTPVQSAVTVPSPTPASRPRAVRVGAVPVSVDFRELDTLARTPAVARKASELRTALGDPDVLLLGVDRMDYTKGIRHRLDAYEELLEEGAIDPSAVVHLELGSVSREGIDTYRRLRQEIEETVRRINDRHSAGDRAAVHLLQEYLPPSERAAAYLAADVMLVTSLRDGMNLVAKEYVACRPDLGGALVLSEFAGAWNELREAFPCNPYDIDETKQAIMSAITAPVADRRRRMEALRRHVAEHDAHRWASDFLQALATAADCRIGGTPPGSVTSLGL